MHRGVRKKAKRRRQLSLPSIRRINEQPHSTFAPLVTSERRHTGDLPPYLRGPRYSRRLFAGRYSLHGLVRPARRPRLEFAVDFLLLLPGELRFYRRSPSRASVVALATPIGSRGEPALSVEAANERFRAFANPSLQACRPLTPDGIWCGIQSSRSPVLAFALLARAQHPNRLSTFQVEKRFLRASLRFACAATCLVAFLPLRNFRSPSITTTNGGGD